MSEEIPIEDFKLDKDLKLGAEFTPPTFNEWKAQVEKDLKGASYEKKLITKTYEGINLNPIYTKSDISDSQFANSLPAADSFVRGNDPAGYLKNTWDVNQEILEADASEFNSALQEALKNGQNCVNVLLDTATKLGLDADYAEPNQVGDKGLSISAISSMKRAFNNIDFSAMPIYLDAGFNSVPILSLLNAHFEANKLKVSNLKGAVTADPIAHLAVYGELPVNQKFVFDMMKSSLEWSNKCAPELRTIAVNTLPFVDAGANAVQELAYAISAVVYYLNELSDRNIDPKTAMNKIQFTLGVSNNYFMEIAKFRAIKVLLSAISEEYGIDSDELKLNIGAKSTSFTQTILDPYVNLLRSTTQSFSAILGGVNNITTTTFDENQRTPDSFSRRIARNTQTILREEAHLDQVIDPAGGSYFIETLTEEIATKAWEAFKQIENEGGVFEALSKGSIQRSIQEVADARMKDINKRKSVIVGTNMFADINEDNLEDRKIDQESFKKKRAEYLEKFRLNGDNEKHQAVMEKLNSISDSPELIDTITEAYLLGTTIGEVNSVLTSTSKEKVSIDKLSTRRASEGFEELRQKAIDYKAVNGSLPKVYLANYGSLREYKGRADFSKGFFEVGGFDVVDPKGVSTIDDAVNGSLESGAPIVVVCSTDDNYPKIVPSIVKGIKDNNADAQIILAGYPKDQIEEHKNSGVDDFIFLGADVMGKLSTLYSKIGGLK